MSTSASSIEWTDRTWNPVRGCSRISAGCRNCYAEAIARRFSREGLAFHGFADGNGWTRNVALLPAALTAPLRWRKPARVFVNSMSDLFHERLSSEAIAAVFAVMACSPQHTFQVLTKRSDRMRTWMNGMENHHRSIMARALSRVPVDFSRALQVPMGWPLPNVWLGVSVEDQDALYRIDNLKDTPAKVRFVSFEPLLQDLGAVMLDGINWAIIGGESGRRARPLGVAWVRSLLKQCRAAGVATFIKQLGADPRGCLAPCDEEGNPPGGDSGCDAYEASEIPTPCPGTCVEVRLKSSKGGDPTEWPEDLRVREFPG